MLTLLRRYQHDALTLLLPRARHGASAEMWLRAFHDAITRRSCRHARCFRLMPMLTLSLLPFAMPLLMLQA